MKSASLDSRPHRSRPTGQTRPAPARSGAAPRAGSPALDGAGRGQYDLGVAANWLKWLWLSGGGLRTCLAVGLALLGAFLAVDLVRKGKASSRLREYLFLLAAVAGAMAFALACDMITVTISPDYFILHGGERPAADWSGSVRALAAVAALKASWTAGLLVGVAMLVANNPSRLRPQLPQRRMYVKLLYPLAGAAAGAVAGGVAAWLVLRDPELVRPQVCVLYAHAGAYVGGLLGVVAGVLAILRQRKTAAPEAQEG